VDVPATVGVNVTLGVADAVRVEVTVDVTMDVDVRVAVMVCDPVSVGVAVETTGPDGAHVFVSLFLHPTIKTAGSNINTMKRLTSLFNGFPRNFSRNQRIYLNFQK
jgi:hypothetical protein